MVDDPFEPERTAVRSVSQLNQYERCPYAYYLSRLRRPRAWQRPAAWLPQGTAFHAALEAVARSNFTMPLEAAQAVFAEEYHKEASRMCGITPNLDWWFKSGPYGARKDLPRRFELGLEQVARFYNWTSNHPDEVIWIAPDGTPGIELRFDIELDRVKITGFIDSVIVDEDGELRVRDYKSGKSPGDDFQLGVYSVAVQQQFGSPAIVVGDYWMGASGKPTYPYDLSDWTPETVGAAFRELEDNLRAERFDPKPEADKCRFCDVSDACRYRMA